MKQKFISWYVVFVIFTNLCVTVRAQVNEQDSLALVDFYNSTDGPNWVSEVFGYSNWLEGPVVTWGGVTITNTRVTEISLFNNNLNGNIPASLGNLVNLEILDLHFNLLRGRIPSSIGNLKNITELVLSDNQLSGSIPSSLGNLVELNHLWLNDNRLSGNLPSSLGNLGKLTILDFSDNQFSGSIPFSFGKLLSLNFLDLAGNQLSGSIPSFLGNLKNLYDLYLSGNLFTGIIPSSLGNLVNIDRLFLYSNQVSGSIPSSLGNLVNLSYLYLSDNQLSGTIPSSLGNLANLSWLYLNNNQLSGSIPSSLGNLGNLEELYLNNNQLSGNIPSSVGNLVNLYNLYLNNNRFTFKGMELIAKTFPFAIYAPQALIPVHQNGSALSVSAGGTLSNNTYKWFRCRKTGITLITTIIGDSVFHPSQSGTYLVKVTNSVATQLTLKSERIKYVAPALLNKPAIASSENLQQQYDKTNLFLVYPNPAKDRVNITTNGNAIISLTDQAGKIIFTKTIEGNGVISVAALPAGLYYLKNNATGETQKVIIAR